MRGHLNVKFLKVFVYVSFKRISSFKHLAKPSIIYVL